MRRQVLTLVGKLRGTGNKGDVRPIPESGKEGIIVEPFLYEERLRSLQNNAGRIITKAIAQTPERYENSIRKGIATSLAEDGQPRTYAINFFYMYVAPVLAEYADVLE